MMKQLITIIFSVIISLPVAAQFAPQAGVAGSTAIHKSDNSIVGWANDCTVERGWMDIADQSQGKASHGSAINATGAPNSIIVSLGDAGTAVVTFEAPIYNGDGPDFAVFENGFVNPADPEEAFLELAFVEVSSDGVNYVRFPATSLTDTPQVPGAGVYMNARKVNNLAGKYRSNYGTPFDLEELKGNPELDIDNITHIRLVDVVGDLGSNGSEDKDGNKINDPYPTPFPSSGFDLDAVGAMHMKGKWPQSVSNVAGGQSPVSVYPNPAKDLIYIDTKNTAPLSLAITDVTGRQLRYEGVNSQTVVKVDIRQLNAGSYYLILNDENGKTWVERFSKY